MPSCRDCVWLTADNTCAVGERMPLRNCVTAIMREYADLLQPGENILEIGCGAWSPVKDRAEAIGCRWEGIDVNTTYKGEPTIATRIASVSEIPFEDEQFDYAIATQSMEHWEEYRVPLGKGLSEVFRVLKPGGWALVNVPIYFHGGTRFVLGRKEELEGLFRPFCDEVRLESWRHPPDPLPPHRYYLRYYWHKPSLWGKSSYVLDIRAQRRPDVPYFDEPPLSTWQKLRSGLRHRGILFYVSLLAYYAVRRTARTAGRFFAR